MASLLESLPVVLRDLFATAADAAAREAGMVNRVRRITGAASVRALVLGWLRDPAAGVTDLALDADRPASAAALDARRGAAGVEGLRPVPVAALERRLAADRPDLAAPAAFPAVPVEDCTAVPLPAAPADAFPGCGNGPHAGTAGRAALEVHVRYDVLTGRIARPALHPGRTADPDTARGAPPPPAGALRLAGLGFFDRDRPAADAAAGAHYVSRVQATHTPRPAGDAGGAVPVLRFPAGQRADEVDVAVEPGGVQLGKRPLRSRLVARRCPPAVAAERARRPGAWARRHVCRPVGAPDHSDG